MLIKYSEREATQSLLTGIAETDDSKNVQHNNNQFEAEPSDII